MTMLTPLNHWDWLTQKCVSKLTIIGSDNGLSSGRRQAIIWTKCWDVVNCPRGTNFSEILTENHTFSLKKTHLIMSSGKWWLFCLGLNVLMVAPRVCCRYHIDHHKNSYNHITAVCYHNDVIKWKHFPRYWPFIRGIHRSRWIPHTKASDAELWCLFDLRPKKNGWVKMVRLLIWDAIVPIMTSFMASL